MVPDDTSSQHGEHEFRFAIVPFAGTWAESAALRVAQEINVPLQVSSPSAGKGTVGTTGSFFGLTGNTVVLSAIKQPFDGEGDIILRLYETAGQQTEASLRFPGLSKAWESDLREERGREIQSKAGNLKLPFEPFEIKTIRISTDR
jgi:alpha-mannosidase